MNMASILADAESVGCSDDEPRRRCWCGLGVGAGRADAGTGISEKVLSSNEHRMVYKAALAGVWWRRDVGVERRSAVGVDSTQQSHESGDGEVRNGGEQRGAVQRRMQERKAGVKEGGGDGVGDGV